MSSDLLESYPNPEHMGPTCYGHPCKNLIRYLGRIGRPDFCARVDVSDSGCLQSNRHGRRERYEGQAFECKTEAANPDSHELTCGTLAHMMCDS